MKTEAEILGGIIDTPERYEIAISIYYNFEELMQPLITRFFDKIKEKVQDKFRLDEKEWIFLYEENENFCLFKRSWQIDKSRRGIYSLILKNDNGSGIIRNRWEEPNNLEEQAIRNTLSHCNGMHRFLQEDLWLLKKHPNPFAWGYEYYRKICDQGSIKFKSLIDECFERFYDLLMLMKEKNLEQVIDECIEARKKSNTL